MHTQGWGWLAGGGGSYRVPQALCVIVLQAFPGCGGRTMGQDMGPVWEGHPELLGPQGWTHLVRDEGGGSGGIKFSQGRGVQPH